MLRPLHVLLVALIAYFAGESSAMAEDSAAAAKEPWHAVGHNAYVAFLEPGALALGIAAGSTAAFAVGGLDASARHWLQERTGRSSFSETMVVTGYTLPVVLPVAVYGFGRLYRDAGTQTLGAALVQASVLAASSTALLKVVTGRSFPLAGRARDAADRLDHPEDATRFSPFRPDRGWAWPSGHVAVTMALASTLRAAMPQRPWAAVILYAVTASLAAGVLVGDHHWVSDVVAGAALGHSVGDAVGRGFRQTPPPSIALVPSPGGFTMTGTW